MHRRRVLVLVLRLVVYAAALAFVLRPQPRPEPPEPLTTFRVSPESERPRGFPILRVTLLSVLLIGVAAECLPRRPAWR
ncbi:MAG TPA: hypothetical protein VGA42_08570 [Gemmatimonadales bacterium]|jgi:hypothetical protein